MLHRVDGTTKPDPVLVIPPALQEITRLIRISGIDGLAVSIGGRKVRHLWEVHDVPPWTREPYFKEQVKEEP